MNINLELYRTFFVVANCLSITEGARQLCLTQSAVSQSVKKLEGELGCALFSRTSRGLRLTREGVVLLSHLRLVFQELQTAEWEVVQLGTLKTGELKIGATETPLRFFLAPKLEAFQKRNPGVRFIFKGGNTREVCEALIKGEVDIACLLAPLPEDMPLHLIAVGEIHDVFVAHRDFPLGCDMPHSAAQLMEYPIISVSEGNSIRGYYDQYFLREGVLFSPRFTVQSTGLVLPLVERGLGIGVLPREYVTRQLLEGTLRELPAPFAMEPRRLYLATRRSAEVSAMEGAFMDFVMGREAMLKEKAADKME